jgi:hypothetical protein
MELLAEFPMGIVAMTVMAVLGLRVHLTGRMVILQVMEILTPMPVRFCCSIIWQFPPQRSCGINSYSDFLLFVVVIIDIPLSSFWLLISSRILSCVALFLAYIHSTDTTVHPIL